MKTSVSDCVRRNDRPELELGVEGRDSEQVCSGIWGLTLRIPHE